MSDYEKKARAIAHAYDAKAAKCQNAQDFLDLIAAITAALKEPVDAETERCANIFAELEYSQSVIARNSRGKYPHEAHGAFMLREAAAAIRSSKTERGE